jgi:hypothetical protein
MNSKIINFAIEAHNNTNQLYDGKLKKCGNNRHCEERSNLKLCRLIVSLRLLHYVRNDVCWCNFDSETLLNAYPQNK